MTVLAIVLALAGAVAYALAAHVQHAAVRTACAPGRGRLGRLVRQRRWFGGLLLIGVGAGLHSAALGLAPLSVVQPLGVLAVVLVAALSAVSARRWPGGVTLTAIGATTAAVGGFVLLTSGQARDTVISDVAIGRTALLAAAGVAVLGALAPLVRGRARCLALATAGGLAYGFVSVSTRVVVQRLLVGGVGATPVLVLIGLVVALLVGGALIQLAYASGPPTVVVACLTMADPFFAVLVGAVLLGEGAAMSPATVAGQVALALVAAGGVVLLARFHPDAAPRTVRDGGEPGVLVGEPAAPAPAGGRELTGRRGVMARRGGAPDAENEATQRIPARAPGAGGSNGSGTTATAPSRTREQTVNGVDSAARRIVVGADTFVPDVNGAARFSYRLATGLAARGHEVHVLAPSPDGAAGVSMMDGVFVHRVRARRTPFHPTFRFCPPWQANAAADDLIAELAPDVVHIQSHMLIGRALSVAANRHRVPLVATNHFMPENLFGYLRLPRALHDAARSAAWRDAAKVFHRAVAVTAPTQRAVELLQENGIEHAEAVSCGIDLDRFAARRAPDAEVPTVLFVGRLDAEKRVDELIRALALLPAALPLNVELVGTGSRRDEWQRLAADLRVGDRVRFSGFVPDEELPAAYERADIFCIPGIAELQSLVTMEAMAAGRPVVAADAMALPHLVHNGDNGWLYQPGDVAGLASRLGMLAADPQLRVRMGAAGRRRVEQHAVPATLRRYEEIYAQVLGERMPEPALAA
ncbi:glycosyltransferase [Actinocatenispora comari]|uniref:Glucosyltransferase n=1 Tax=Actinocatenispora comari TaxID=2807577 RepID=A0A8J4AAW6_9ACTN|nr:glycosyltransferase [Actinocatenispora comari]GIL25802.1 glucosyltransferase [Actinocatenispora comari]